MKKSFVVIGLGRFGSNVAKTLADMKCDVLAIDIKEESVKGVSKQIPHCVIADATKYDVLSELGAGTTDHAVVAIGGNLQASILTIVNLKKLNVKHITVRADVADDYVMVKIIVGKKFVAKSLIEMDIRNNFDVNIVGIIKNDVFAIPHGTDKINPNDIVVVAGKKPNIRKFDTFLNN